MAVTLTQDGEWTFASFPIEKTETDENGDLYVYGKATDGAVDSDDQIVDPVWAAKALKDWLDTGANLRVQHNPSRDPAGIGVEISDDGRGGQWVKSLVVEPVAKNLVKKGVLQAYSVGIMRPVIVPDQLARHGRIVGGELGELSLVDRPANKGCRFELVKSYGGAPQFVGKMFGTDTLNKAHTSTQLSDLPNEAQITFKPSDLAKFLAKRDFDRGVGGGVDRDTLPASDFGDPDARKFPIVTPGDVSDAGGLIGHADSPENVKRRIISIAHRKGPDFVAQLPDSWKEGSTEADDTNKALADEDELTKAKKPFEGAAKPFKKDNDGDGKPERGEYDDDKDSDSDDDGDDAKDDQAKPEVTKGSKDCPKCGKSHHADSKLKRCESCNAKLPKADKSADSGELFKGGKGGTTAMGDDNGGTDAGSEQDDDLDDSASGAGGDPGEFDDRDDSDNSDSSGAKDAKKGAKVKVPCPGCSKSVKVGSKFCPKCGGGMSIGKSAQPGRTKPTPADGVTGQDAAPVPEHREPDGPQVEAFEADAKLPTDPDAQYKALMYTKSRNIPDDLATLHDLLCPAYSSEAAHAAHPHSSLKSVDMQSWRERAFQAATSASIEEAMAATKRLEHIGTLSQAPDFLLDELHAEAHAAFKAINPENTTSLRPGSITPGSFRRPYISSDARPSFQAQGPNSGPGGFGSVSANSFERDYLTGGRAKESPTGGGSTTIPKPSTTGVPKSLDYTNVMRDNARQARAAMHDHIAQTFPDLCAMGPNAHEARPTNPGIGKAATVQSAVPVPPVADAVPTDATADDTRGVEMLMKSFGPDVIVGALEQVLAPIRAQLEATQAALLEQREANKAMEVQLNKLADLPDPSVAPFRGVAMDVAFKSSGPLGAAPTAAGIAERAQLAVQNELYQQTFSSDPAQREAALNALYKMRGFTSQH